MGKNAYGARLLDHVVYAFAAIFFPLVFFIIIIVVSPTGSRPPSRNRNNEMPGDEELGFEAAVAALGGYAFSIRYMFN